MATKSTKFDNKLQIVGEIVNRSQPYAMENKSSQKCQFYSKLAKKNV
uniref:Single-stranded DNA-binding protein n=1 Tax=Romanomermis culicivorax TaxID=13658 RepID=A0A915KBA4_ROMCU